MQVTEILEKLCTLNLIASNEASLFSEACSVFGDKAKIECDKIGNIYIKIGSDNAKNKILIDAHCDQIGFVVTDFYDNGFLKVAAVGGIDARAAFASRVLVFGEETLEGVFSTVPPHLQKGSDSDKFPAIDELAIDIGLSKNEAEALISRGDFVLIKSEFSRLGENKVCSAALDNKAGVAALFALGLKLTQAKLKNTCVTLLLSVQEELGLRGAFAAEFDADEVIVIDTSFGSYPGAPSEKTGKLVGGVMLGHSPILSRPLTEKIEKIAVEKDILIQHEILSESTGTNADRLTLKAGGVDCALISLPILNMHSASEILDLSDLNSLIDLLEAYVREADEK
ncbi:MAG: hypothetical protein IJY33_05915 [Oscillospiraceae bacterium]|nr:hypothetical protein [Oscillospiraceae bacterium]